MTYFALIYRYPEVLTADRALKRGAESFVGEQVLIKAHFLNGVSCHKLMTYLIMLLDLWDNNSCYGLQLYGILRTRSSFGI
jgi:hypothetical protein